MTTPFPVVIYHNPGCGTSRNVLSIIEAAGYSRTIIDYQKDGWTVGQLQGIFAASCLTAREALREIKFPAADLGLLATDVTEEAIIHAMVAHPILVNCPFVMTPIGVRLCRPSEVVLELLDRLPPGPLLKEDGEVIVDTEGRRI